MSQTQGDKAENRREVACDLASGAFALALALVLSLTHFLQSGRLHEDFGAEPGPALLPELLLACLGVAGVGLSARGLWGLRRLVSARVGPALSAGRVNGSLGTVLIVALLLVAFLPFRAAFGFAPALLVFGAAIGALLGRQDGRLLPLAAAEGALIAAVLYGLFRFVLSVPLT